MDKLDRIYALDKLLRKRKTVITRVELENRLGLKRATTTRLIAFCKDSLGMPIEFDKERGGYCYAESETESYQLPGLWFNPSEILALMTSHRLLAAVQPGVLEPLIAPLQQRIEQLLTHKHAGSSAIFDRIRILPMANRIAKLEDFKQVTNALIHRKQLRITYSSRSNNEKLTERWLSPQRLIYYRDNWYLDAWCHKREALRTFALDRLHVVGAGAAAKEINSQELNDHVMHTYGIFAGPMTNTAVIHFSSAAAEWVADEQWHPQQQSQYLDNGKWELVVPYGNPTELVMDILKYGPDAEVVSPPELRELVTEKISQALRNYRKMKKV